MQLSVGRISERIICQIDCGLYVSRCDVWYLAVLLQLIDEPTDSMSAVGKDE